MEKKYEKLTAIAEKVKYRIDESLFFKRKEHPDILLGILYEIFDNALNELEDNI